MKRAVFLDRDGVLIEDRGYIETFKEIKIYPYTINALKKLNKYFELFIVTNQSGIGKNLITEKGVKKVNDYILEEFKKHNIKINQLYCCPHTKEDDCDCRKPNPYFIHQAIKKHNIDIEKSYVIGDHPSDVEFGLNAGAKGIYVLTGHGKKHIDDLKNKDLIFDSLKEATEWILGNV
ncbi:MAG: HAD-IIIA family hydrolase [Firmicutes bacterium]|nr:HAD-IIIA family hydrolase [Bacillota bacterium]